MNNLDINYIEKNIDTSVFGKKIMYYETIKSTNTFAKQLAKENNEHGTVIIADNQTEGRGTQDRKWVSHKDTGICMSLIISPSCDINNSIKIPTLAGLAIRKALNQTTGLEVFIKWPNDIIINKKKVCGILVESVIEGIFIKSLIVGIGINVNQQSDFFKEDINHATSLSVEKGKIINREKVICSILSCFEKYYNEFMKVEALNVKEIEQASILLNKKVRVLFDGKEIIGTVDGFIEDGSINIKNYANEIINIKSGSASIRGIDSYLD